MPKPMQFCGRTLRVRNRSHRPRRRFFTLQRRAVVDGWCERAGVRRAPTAGFSATLLCLADYWLQQDTALRSKAMSWATATKRSHVRDGPALVESRSDTPQASWRRVEWTFDPLGRRIRQTTSVWTNNTWAVVEDLKFISDPLLFGRHIAELNGTNSDAVRTYVWGLDLSGTEQGAGGVGGLLMFTHHGSPVATHFSAYDGNGNVVVLVSASDGSPTAHYEYGPFGEPIRVTGPAAALNPFRFSTKRTDPTTDLVLYEYRAYNLTLGRWTHRDPVASHEFGLTHEDVVQKMADEAIEGMGQDSHNAYLFVRNSSTDAVDLLGLVEVETGVNRAETPLRYIAIEAHYFLEVEGTTCGFWPKGGKKKLLSLLPFMWVRGEVRSPDDMAPARRLAAVKLEKCKYDIKRFKSCVQAQCHWHVAGRYNLLFHNCWHWRESLIEKCKQASRR